MYRLTLRYGGFEKLAAYGPDGSWTNPPAPARMTPQPVLREDLAGRGRRAPPSPAAMLQQHRTAASAVPNVFSDGRLPALGQAALSQLAPTPFSAAPEPPSLNAMYRGAGTAARAPRSTPPPVPPVAQYEGFLRQQQQQAAQQQQLVQQQQLAQTQQAVADRRARATTRAQNVARHRTYQRVVRGLGYGAGALGAIGLGAGARRFAAGRLGRGAAQGAQQGATQGATQGAQGMGQGMMQWASQNPGWAAAAAGGAGLVGGAMLGG